MADEVRGIFNRGAFREKYRMVGAKPKAFRPRTWNNFVSEVGNFIAAGQITSFAGGTFRRTSAGTALGVSPGIGGASSPNTYPYQGTDASTAESPMVTVRFGAHNNFPPTIDGTSLMATPAPTLTLDSGAQCVYAQFDLTVDGYGNVTISDGLINSSNSPACPPTTYTPAVGGGGAGTFYQTLFGVAVTAPASSGGKYVVNISPNIQTAMEILICGAALYSQPV